MYLLLLLLGSMGLAKAQQQPVATITGFQFPESVNTDGRYLYVSNIGAKLEPTVKDGDGFISRLDLNGKLLDQKFITGLSAPKGMAIVQQVLYVADIDSIKGFRLSDGARIFALGFGGQTSFLNDLAAKDAHTLFVSATDIGKVFEVQLGRQPAYREIVLSEKIKGANGLSYDAAAQQLYVVTLGEGNEPGRIGVIQFGPNGATYKNSSDYTGFLDGAAVLPGNRLLFTDWTSLTNPVSGTVNILDMATGKITTIANKLQGAADLLYIPSKNITWVPEMVAGRLKAYQL